MILRQAECAARGSKSTLRIAHRRRHIGPTRLCSWGIRRTSRDFGPL